MILHTLLWNKYLPYQAVSVLTTSEVDFMVARNYTTPEHVLAVLAAHEKPGVRAEATRNIHAPAEVLEHSTHDESFFVRMAAAQNPNTPSACLHTLAYDQIFLVRYYVAQNPNTWLGTRRMMCTEVDHMVRKVASEYLDKL